MFGHELHARQLVQPFPIAVETGGYWLTWLKSRPLTPAMEAFRAWSRTPEFRQEAYEAA
jgi:LysR family transcriptional regulator of beta-lactamase